MTRVLLIDDHVDGVAIAAMLLEVLGYECLTAATGTDGLAALAEFAADIAIVDVGLPDLSGYEVAREIRKRLGAGIYLAALTGWGQPEDRINAFAAGFDEHVVKPANAAIYKAILANAAVARARRG